MNSPIAKIIAFIVFSLYSSLTWSNGNCANQIGTCGYYTCKESELQCGSKGYLLEYGHRYCNKFFSELESQLTSSGSQWIQNAATCLQEKIEFNSQSDKNCKKVKKLAYSSHSVCYSKASFCELPFEDKFKIISFLKKELYKVQTQKEGLQVLLNCFRSK